MILLSAVIVITSYLFVNPMSLVPRLIFKASLIIAFPILLYFFSFYEQVELDKLKGAWDKWKNPKNWNKNLKNIKIK